MGGRIYSNLIIDHGMIDWQKLIVHIEGKKRNQIKKEWFNIKVVIYIMRKGKKFEKESNERERKERKEKILYLLQ